MFVCAQRLEVVESNGYNYLAVYAYGLPREVVKTNDQMRASKTGKDGLGLMRRHETNKGEEYAVGDDGYAANEKLSFAFCIAPHNIGSDGLHVEESSSGDSGLLTWTKASGWSSDIDDDLSTDKGGSVDSITPEEPTGCAAYRGAEGKDEAGSWRLPTQREAQTMFTIMGQATALVASGLVENHIVDGDYWTATEFSNADAPWKAWSIKTTTGYTYHEERTAYYTKYARCVKDIYESINEVN